MEKAGNLLSAFFGGKFFTKRKYRCSFKELKKGLFTYGNFDMLFFVIVLALLGYGLIMQFSASYPYAYYREDDSLYFFKRQAFFAVLGIIAMLFVSRISYETWYKLSNPILVLTYFLLIIVLFLPEVKSGFKRWINLGFTTFQPSEIAKFTLILQCAIIFDMFRREMFSSKVSKGKFAKQFAGNGFRRFIKESWYPTILAIMLAGSFAGLVYLENHLSGALILVFIGAVMMYLGGVNDKLFIVGVVAVVSVAAIVCIVIMKTKDSDSTNILKSYMGDRILSWLDKDYDPLGLRWQTNHSLYAIGSGGFFGVGLGNSTQKYMYVSEPQNDFIFAIVCEELGFVGAAALILLFVLLVWRGIVIGVNAKTRFGGFLSMGIVLQVGIQVILNIAVATDTLPNTGISLPFFSYGGTSLVVFLVQMGIVLSVSRTAKIKSFKNSKTEKQTVYTEEAV